MHTLSDSDESFCDVFCVIVQDDMQRKVIWEENKQMIEDNNQRFFMGMRPFTMAMNKYGDLVRTSVCSLMLKYKEFMALTS